MDELINKYFGGELTENQKNDLFKQLSVNPEAQKEFAGIQNTVALAGLSPSEHDAEIAGKYLDDFRQKHKRKALRTFFISFSKYAAIIAVVVTVCYYTFYSNNKKAETHDAVAYNYLTVPAGQRVKLTLNDGTTVWLNSSSTLSYPGLFTGNTREVILEGEAYFDVAHDEKKMFIVKTQQFDIRVFGTEFNVRAYAYNPLSEVSLLKGSVEVKPVGDSHTYRMKENEMISFCENRIVTGKPHKNTGEAENLSNDALKKIEIDSSQLTLPILNYEYFKWKDGIICFDNETVEEIIKKLEMYYDIRIDVKKPALLKSRYSGKFRSKDGIEQVIKVLQLEHKFSYTRDNEKNIITIK